MRMIRLPDKSKCKRKAFKRAFITGNFMYMEFMSCKSGKSWYGGLNERNMKPRRKIYKVLDKTTLNLVYLDNDKGNLISLVEAGIDAQYNNNWEPKLNTIISAHNIWSWFQKDEIRHIKSMSKDELAVHYLMEII